ncbi:MAG: hypothetical protein V4726_21585 [Verrucomicrobiota bacterium]
MTQPTPSVTHEDVIRIVRRDFGDGKLTEVQAHLAAYGAQDGQRDTARVHLGILKLADGRMDRLRQMTEIACSDWRDVLSPAEYRRYAALAWSGRTDAEAPQQAIEDDWTEYQSWLTRT